MTASVIVSPSFASASSFSFLSTIAEISGGEYVFPPTSTCASPFPPCPILKGISLMSLCTSGSLNFRPIILLIEKTVFSGLVTAWRFAVVPTYLSPDFAFTPIIEGVVRAPSAFSTTLGSPASMTAMQEFVVPRSIPSTFAIFNLPP